ncbi:MAG: VCBS repeat-containing protein [Pyrinomonadaceae bacterium]|nr:VCBS repeat-containing protein [Pyrinomonadaceae bacterium]
MTRSTTRFAVFTFIIGLFLSIQIFGITKIDLETPANSGAFGAEVVSLPNGNIVVTDPGYSLPGAQNAGAVYLFDGETKELIGTITGERTGSRVGFGGITVLGGGNFLISSPYWGSSSSIELGAVTFVPNFFNGTFVVSATNSLVGSSSGDRVGRQGIVTNSDHKYVVISHSWDLGGFQNAGAITFCRLSLGCRGVVSSANSLVGSRSSDLASSSVTVLTNGNFVVGAPGWDNNLIHGNPNVGAVTFIDSAISISGTISAGNSLIGSHEDDRVGFSVFPLSNGNYVVRSGFWANGSEMDAGAVTFANGDTGITGVVSPSNSLVGSSAGNSIGRRIVPLQNGNYVVGSPDWDNGGLSEVGAVTLGSGTNGITGIVSPSNSLVGSSAGDRVGFFVRELTNGNFVVGSSYWDNGSIVDVGSATFVNGTTGLTGPVTDSNSLVGSTAGDRVSIITPLNNGNYVVSSGNWDNGNVVDAGAVTFGNGNAGISGIVSTANSLVGSSADDGVGGQVIALTNGNYVVSSSQWGNGGVQGAGAVTFGNGTTGITGVVSPTNSLVGSSTDDQVGYRISALTNGNYVVKSPFWDNGGTQNVGAVTFGNGTSGINGIVSSANSLIGSTVDDRVGMLSSDSQLPNGNYFVDSPLWDNGPAVDAGAIALGNGQTGTVGVVSPSTSLVGSTSDDRLSGLTVLENGNYVVLTGSWDNGSIVDAGAITYVDEAGLTGPINGQNSVLGTTAGGGFSITYVYDSINDQLIVGLPNENKVTLVTLTENTQKTRFDFDGDSKTDVSIFRPGPAEWWFLRSSDGGNSAFQFGQTSDTLVPADFTDDGKTDVAFWRESTGEWFVLRSEDNSFFSFPFGTSGDIPAPGDYDGDGKSDAAVFRPAIATWFISRSSDGGTDIIGFGAPGDKPVVADYDADGKDDVAIYRPSNSQWWINRSQDGLLALQFGSAGDKTVQGDYTGDGKADIAFWRKATGEWFVIRSEDNSFFSFPFGANGDVPSPGDYDGDGTQDAAVFRPATNTWFVNGSTSGTQIIGFGATGDVPLPSAYVYE